MSYSIYYVCESVVVFFHSFFKSIFNVSCKAFQMQSCLEKSSLNCHKQLLFIIHYLVVSYLKSFLAVLSVSVYFCGFFVVFFWRVEECVKSVFCCLPCIRKANFFP